jgi:uncharacterized protein (DUF433 family)
VRIGDLLLQEKAITQEQLQKALDYQKENHGIRIGEALVKLGFVDIKTLVGTLAKQKPSSGGHDATAPPKQETTSKGTAVRLGEILLRGKVVTPEQLRKAVEYQQQHPGTMFGKALIELGFVTEESIADALLKQQQKQEAPLKEISSEPGKPMKLGEILLSENVITQEQLEKALQYQERYQGITLGKAIIDLGFASDKTISSALKKQRRGT